MKTFFLLFLNDQERLGTIEQFQGGGKIKAFRTFGKALMDKGDRTMALKAMKQQTQISEYELELNTLEDEITEALDAAIGDLADDKDFRLLEIQPPSSIVRAAAVAAAQVLMGFERGYRMSLRSAEDHKLKGDSE